MPAQSKSQQRLFGMLHAYNKGELHGSKSLMKKMKSMSSHISDEDARHFAETPHKGLPEKKAALGMGANPLLLNGLPRDVQRDNVRRIGGTVRNIASRDFMNNLTDGADMLATGAMNGATYLPLLPFSLGSGLYGAAEGLATGQDMFDSAVGRAKETADYLRSLGPKGMTLADVQKRLSGHANFIVDNYRRRNMINEGSGDPLEIAAMTGLRAANTSGEWIGGTMPGAKTVSAVSKGKKIVDRIPLLKKILKASGKPAATGAVVAPGAIESVTPAVESRQQAALEELARRQAQKETELRRIAQRITEDNESTGWKADAEEQLEKMSPFKDPDPVALSSAPSYRHETPGSGLPGYLRAENNTAQASEPGSESDTPVTWGDVGRFVKPTALTGAGIGALLGGTLGYALTDKRKSRWQKARNAALAALAAGAVGGLSGSAYKLYNASRGKV